MKKACLIISVLFYFTSYSQNTLYDSIHLSISPGINQQDEFSKQIITTLKNFLETMDSSYTENRYWLKSDFEKYVAPYSDLEGLGGGRLGKHYYQPSLMEIIETDRADRKIVKVAFVGHNNKTNTNLIRAIYNIVATKKDDNVVFSEYMDYTTRNWKELKEEHILYKISPCRSINFNDISRQKSEVNTLCKFLNTTPLSITFYSCTSPKELFELLGFDYHPNIYLDTSGGWSRDKNIVISANNSEYYLHEITHLYLRHLFPPVNAFFNEGFATYTGGSGKFDYQWQRNKLKKFLDRNPDFKCEEHIEDPYDRLYFEHETPVPYVLGALVCERTVRLYGKEKLFDVFRSDKNVFDTLQTVGLTKENMTEELRKEIKLLPTLYCCKRG